MEDFTQERQFYQQTIANLLHYQGLLITKLFMDGQMPPPPVPYPIPVPTSTSTTPAFSFSDNKNNPPSGFGFPPASLSSSSPLSFGFPLASEEDMKKIQDIWKNAGNPFNVDKMLTNPSLNKMFTDAMKKWTGLDFVNDDADADADDKEKLK